MTNILDTPITSRNLLKIIEKYILSILCVVYIGLFPLLFAIFIISQPGWNYVFTGELTGLFLAVILIMTPYMFGYTMTSVRILYSGIFSFSKNEIDISTMKSLLGLDLETVTASSNPFINVVGACVTNIFFISAMIALNNPPSTILLVIDIANLNIIVSLVIFILFLIYTGPYAYNSVKPKSQSNNQ